MSKEFEIEKLKEYENYIKTKEGKEWISKCKRLNMNGDFGDFLYDNYPEILA